jgi:hypothetical protein
MKHQRSGQCRRFCGPVEAGDVPIAWQDYGFDQQDYAQQVAKQ